MVRMGCGVVLLVLMAVPGHAWGQSPTFRGGAARTGVYPAQGTASSGIEVWTYQAQGPIRSTPAVDGGEIFVGTGAGTVVALEQRSGAEKWVFQARAAVHSSPAVSGGLVFFADRSNRVYAVDRGTGAARWEVATDEDHPWAWGTEGWDYFLSSPVVEGGRVIVGSGDGGVYAFDAATGRLLWTYETGGRVRSSPAAAHGRVYVGSADGVLYALDAGTGELAWAFETHGASWRSSDFQFDRVTIQGSPAVRDGVVYFGSRDGRVYAVDAGDGELLWETGDADPWFVTSPAVSGEMVINGSSDGLFVHALDRRTGAEIWRTNTGERVFSSPALAGDAVLVGNQGGRFMKLDARTGSLDWEVRLGTAVMSSPVVADGHVFFGADDGQLHALRLEDGPPPLRGVYWDSARVAWNTLPDHEATRDALRRRGYAVLDAPSLAAFMERARREGRRSVVVFAQDDLPPQVAAGPSSPGLFQDYLAAGGKVVWLGMPPYLLIRDSLGAVTGNDRGRPSAFLGVDHSTYNVDRYAAMPTDAGRRWGLSRWWIGGSGVRPAGVSQVLALDENGLASAWVRDFGAGEGTGFVSVWGTFRRMDPGFIDEILAVAEYGIGRVAR